MRFNMIRFKMIAQKRNHRKEDMTIGSAIKYKRHELGLTLEEASKNICSISYLSKLENNLIVPNEKYVMKLKQRFCIKEDHQSIESYSYDTLKQQLSDAIFHHQTLPDTFIKQIGNQFNYRTMLLTFGWHVIQNNQNEINQTYTKILPLLTSMPDEAFALMICLLSIMLHRRTRYQDANDLLAMIPDENIPDELLLFRDKWRLIHAIKTDNTALFHLLYASYKDTLIRLGYYRQMDELKHHKLLYFSNMLSVSSYQSLLKQYHHIPKETHELAMLNNLIANGCYQEVLTYINKKSSLYPSQVLMKILALDGCQKNKDVIRMLHEYGHIKWAYREHILMSFIKAKYLYNKEKLLLYLRTVILGSGFLTDDVFVLKFIQKQAHALFRKYFYYKEATEVYMTYQHKIEQLRKSNYFINKEPERSFFNCVLFISIVYLLGHGGICMRVIRLLKLAKGYWLLFLLAVLITALHQYINSNVPLFTQYLIKTLMDQPGVAVGTASVGEVHLPDFLLAFFKMDTDVLNIVFRIAASLVMLQVFRFTLRFFDLWLRGHMMEGTARDMRLKMYHHIQNLDYKFHNNVDTGDLIQRVTTDIETTSRFLTNRLLDFSYLIFTLLFGAYQLYLLNPTMVWFTLALAPIMAASSTIYFTKIDKIFQEVEEKESEMITVVQESIAGSRVVRAFANESFEVEKMNEKNSRYRQMQIKATNIISIYWGSMDFISMNQYLVIIAVGAFSITNGKMDAADVITALQLVGMLIWPIRGLGRLISDFSKALVSSDRLNEILDKPSEFNNDGTLTPNIKGDIQFDHVSFKFDDSQEHLLKDVSFHIKAGQTVAIIGKTGSGKSTIINLLLRMYDYQSGHIYVDGIPLKDIQKKHIRHEIGVVLQDPFLYSKTVFDNIAIAQKNAPREHVVEAARIAALEKDINTFQQGYDTIVGEKGTTLSGGQKQRVAIARVLVSDKPILIFDDALSAVDTKTDMMIREALTKKDHAHTTIIITHRITTAKEADKIIVLNNGKIEAIGTHQSLSKQPGLYQKIWHIQGRLEREFIEMVKAGENDAS